jgi:hypothetical protein
MVGGTDPLRDTLLCWFLGPRFYPLPRDSLCSGTAWCHWRCLKRVIFCNQSGAEASRVKRWMLLYNYAGCFGEKGEGLRLPGHSVMTHPPTHTRYTPFSIFWLFVSLRGTYLLPSYNFLPCVCYLASISLLLLLDRILHQGRDIYPFGPLTHLVSALKY